MRYELCDEDKRKIFDHIYDGQSGGIGLNQRRILDATVHREVRVALNKSSGLAEYEQDRNAELKKVNSEATYALEKLW